MLRSIAFALVLAAGYATAFADPPAPDGAPAAEEDVAPAPRRDDPFVRYSDECGASRYAHLVGEQYAEVYQASLPASAYVLGSARATTLEYKPGRLNVVLDGRGRIAAISCS